MNKNAKADNSRGKMWIIFGLPGTEAGKEQLRELVRATGEEEHDIHYETTSTMLHEFVKKSDGKSSLDKLFSIVLEKEVLIREPNVTWVMLEGKRWPAVEIYEDDIYTVEGEQVNIDFVSEETKEKIIKERIIPCCNHVFDSEWIKVLTSKLAPEPQIHIPKSVAEAMAELKISLKPEMIESIKRSDDSDDYHFSLGQWIRNRWGLWQGSPLAKELIKKGVDHPDDMSNYIIKAFHKYLNGEEIE